MPENVIQVVAPPARLPVYSGEGALGQASSQVGPAALASGAAGALALLITVVTAARSGNVLMAMIAGVAAMWLFLRI